MFSRSKSHWANALKCSLLAALLLSTTAWAAGVPSSSQHADYSRTLSAIRKVARNCAPCYIFIGGGSGAIISADGLVITNDHVVRMPAGPTIPMSKRPIRRKWRIQTPRGKTYAANLLGTCPDTDLALLRIVGAKDLDFIPLGDSDKLKPGDQVVAIGNPFLLGREDLEPTVTVGIVSAVHLNQRGAPDAVMTDTPINPGNSGGPLINLDGELVGVNGQIATRHGVRANTGAGYAISSNQLKRYIGALKAAGGKSIRAGMINGLQFKYSETDPAIIEKVDPKSAAAKAGFKDDDIITSIDGVPVRTVIELGGVLPRVPAGTEVTIELETDGVTRAVKYKLEVPKPPPARPRLYVGLALDLEKQKKATIKKVVPDSPADKAGIKAGDIVEKLVIKGMDPIELKSAILLPVLLQRVKPGQSVKLEVLRGEKRLTLTLKVGQTKKPPQRGIF